MDKITASNIMNKASRVVSLWSPWWNSYFKHIKFIYSHEYNSITGLSSMIFPVSLDFIENNNIMDIAIQLEFALQQCAKSIDKRSQEMKQKHHRVHESLIGLACALEINSDIEDKFSSISDASWERLKRENLDESFYSYYGVEKKPTIPRNWWTSYDYNFPPFLSAESYLELLIKEDEKREQDWLDKDDNDDDNPGDNQDNSANDSNDSNALEEDISDSNSSNDNNTHNSNNAHLEDQTSDDNDYLDHDHQNNNHDSRNETNDDSQTLENNKNDESDPIDDAVEDNLETLDNIDESAPESDIRDDNISIDSDSHNNDNSPPGEDIDSENNTPGNDDNSQFSSKNNNISESENDNFQSVFDDIKQSDKDKNQLTLPEEPHDIKDHNEKEIDDQEKEKIDNDLAKSIEEYENEMSKRPGSASVGKGFSEWKKKRIGKSKSSWKKILPRILYQAMGKSIMSGQSDMSFAKRNPNQQKNMPLMMGFITYPPNITIIIDSSPSMLRFKDTTMKEFLGVTTHFFKQYGDPVTVCSVDSSIKYAEQTIVPSKKILKEAGKTHHSGSEDFGKILETILKKGVKYKGRSYPVPDVTVVLTDCVFDWPFETMSTLPRKYGHVIVVSTLEYDKIEDILPKWVKKNKNFVSTV